MLEATWWREPCAGYEAAATGRAVECGDDTRATGALSPEVVGMLPRESTALLPCSGTRCEPRGAAAPLRSRVSTENGIEDPAWTEAGALLSSVSTEPARVEPMWPYVGYDGVATGWAVACADDTRARGAPSPAEVGMVARADTALLLCSGTRCGPEETAAPPRSRVSTESGIEDPASVSTETPLMEPAPKVAVCLEVPKVLGTVGGAATLP